MGGGVNCPPRAELIMTYFLESTCILAGIYSERASACHGKVEKAIAELMVGRISY